MEAYTPTPRSASVKAELGKNKCSDLNCNKSKVTCLEFLDMLSCHHIKHSHIKGQTVNCIKRTDDLLISAGENNLQMFATVPHGLCHCKTLPRYLSCSSTGEILFAYGPKTF